MRAGSPHLRSLELIAKSEGTVPKTRLTSTRAASLGDPKTTLTFVKHWEDSQNSLNYCVITVYYKENITDQKWAKGRRAIGQHRNIEVPNTELLLLSAQSQDAILPRLPCDSVHGILPTREAPLSFIAQNFYWGFIPWWIWDSWSADIAWHFPCHIVGSFWSASPHGETVCVDVASPHWNHVGTLSSMTQGPQANKDTSGSHNSPRVQRGPPGNRASAPHTSWRGYILRYTISFQHSRWSQSAGKSGSRYWVIIQSQRKNVNTWIFIVTGKNFNFCLHMYILVCGWPSAVWKGSLLTGQKKIRICPFYTRTEWCGRSRADIWV